MKGLTNATMRSQLERKNRNKKIKVEHHPDDVEKTKNKKLKSINEGKINFSYLITSLVFIYLFFS